MKHFVFTLFIYLTLSSLSHAQESKGQIEVVGISLVKEIPEDVSIRIPLTIVDSTYLNCSKRLNQLLSDLGKMESFLLTDVVRSRLDNVTHVCNEFRHLVANKSYNINKLSKNLSRLFEERSKIASRLKPN